MYEIIGRFGFLSIKAFAVSAVSKKAVITKGEYTMKFEPIIVTAAKKVTI